MTRVSRFDLHALDPSFPADPSATTDEVSLWWLGQAGFALRFRDLLVVIDPYLSDSLATKYQGAHFPHRRLFPPPVDPARVLDCTALLCTHAHTDHMDPATVGPLVGASDPWVVVPAAEADLAVKRGARRARLHGLTAGSSVSIAEGVVVHAVPAAHEELSPDEFGRHRHLGYVIALGDVRIYHSGDCVPYPGQSDVVAALAPGIALLPVNGRDEERSSRGVPGNFHVEEALKLCEAAEIPMLLPHHVGLFDFNTVRDAEIEARLGTNSGPTRWVLPDLGRRYRIVPGRQELR